MINAYLGADLFVFASATEPMACPGEAVLLDYQLQLALHKEMVTSGIDGYLTPYPKKFL